MYNLGQLGSVGGILGSFLMNFEVTLEPFGMSSYHIGRFMPCVGRLLRLTYADPDFWHVDIYLAVTEINNAIGCEAAA